MSLKHFETGILHHQIDWWGSTRKAEDKAQATTSPPPRDLCDIPQALLAAQGQRKGGNKWLTDRDHSRAGQESPSVHIYLSDEVLEWWWSIADSQEKNSWDVYLFKKVISLKYSNRTRGQKELHWGCEERLVIYTMELGEVKPEGRPPEGLWCAKEDS